nr:aldo/keto reductase [Bifidobacterium felsineum]
MGLDYLDLYLIHQPYGDHYGSRHAMEELLGEGRVRAIGVCNFPTRRPVDLYLHVDVKPAVNQIESHPLYQRNKDHKVMEEYGIPAVTSGMHARRFIAGDVYCHPVRDAIGPDHSHRPNSDE